MLIQDIKQNTRNEYSLGQQTAYRHLEEFEKPGESCRVSEKVSDRMIDSAVGRPYRQEVQEEHG